MWKAVELRNILQSGFLFSKLRNHCDWLFRSTVAIPYNCLSNGHVSWHCTANAILCVFCLLAQVNAIRRGDNFCFRDWSQRSRTNILIRLSFRLSMWATQVNSLCSSAQPERERDSYGWYVAILIIAEKEMHWSGKFVEHESLISWITPETRRPSFN